MAYDGTDANSGQGGGIYNAGTLTVTNSTIRGNSANYLGGGGIYNNGGTLTITYSSINNNLASNATLVSSGGGIDNEAGSVLVDNCTLSGNSASYNGGAIQNLATMTVTNSIFTGNTATDSGGAIEDGDVLMVNHSTFRDNSAGLSGGGMGGAGVLSVSDSSFYNNAANLGGGGIYLSPGTLTVTDSVLRGNSAGSSYLSLGGGIYCIGTFLVSDSTINSNAASYGGGVYTARFGTQNEIRKSTISDNSATGNGGGIQNDGSLTVSGSTISGNSADHGGDGGGITNGGDLIVSNSTIHGNSATINGGGIENYGNHLSITDSTLNENSVTDDRFGGGGGVYSYYGTLTINMNIFVNNVGGNLSFDPRSGGTFISLGHNLFSDSPSLTLAPTDLIDTDPLLGPLANNGGPTFTQALLPGSPAIDAGVAVAGVTTDQRGIARPQGAAPDIGAFESRGFSLVIVSGNDQKAATGSAFPVPLVVQVTSAFGEPVAGGHVTFSAPMSGPSATFSSNTVTLDAEGRATVVATANGLAGAYNVTANMVGANRVEFHLTNVVIPPTVVGLKRVGIRRQKTRLVLSFSKPLELASATDVHNYSLVRVGPAGKSAAHPRMIAVRSAVYDPTALTVTLTPRHRLNLHWLYRLTVNATGAGGVAGVDGTRLDGTDTGSPGSDYVAVVHRFGAVTIKASRGVHGGPMRHEKIAQ